MRRLFLLALAVAFAVAAGSAACSASPQSASAVIVFHAQAHNAKADLCGDAATFVRNDDCSQYTVVWPLDQGADVYLVAVDTIGDEGIAGLSCGIDYDEAVGSGADVLDWTLCADLEFPDDGPHGPWPAAESGNRIFWDPVTNCQTSPYYFETHGVAGAFYVFAYADDHFRATVNNAAPGGPELYVQDCNSANWDMEYFQLGEVVFTDGSAFPFHPCPFPDPVEPKSWGSVKSLYRARAGARG